MSDFCKKNYCKNRRSTSRPHWPLVVADSFSILRVVAPTYCYKFSKRAILALTRLLLVLHLLLPPFSAVFLLQTLIVFVGVGAKIFFVSVAGLGTLAPLLSLRLLRSF